MSVPDNTNTVNNSPDITGLAVAVGRIEEGQKFMQATVNEVKETVGGLASTVGAHAVALQAQAGRIDGHDNRLNAHDARFEETRPVKVSWQSIGMFILGVVGIGWTVADKIFTP